MSRETENALLLLVGLSTAIIAFTGAYTRYVKPALLPWLWASAAVLIVLALIAIVGDIRHGPRDGEHAGHAHRSGCGVAAGDSGCLVGLRRSPGAGTAIGPAWR